VSLHWQALTTRLALNIPQALNNINRLHELRTTLGRDEFTRIATDAFGEESTNNLNQLLDQVNEQGE
jgi:hypothetical protein